MIKTINKLPSQCKARYIYLISYHCATYSFDIYSLTYVWASLTLAESQLSSVRTVIAEFYRPGSMHKTTTLSNLMLLLIPQYSTITLVMFMVLNFLNLFILQQKSKSNKILSQLHH